MCLSVCRFVLVFFGPFGVAVASLGEEGAGLGVFRAFARFVLVWVCLFSLLLGIWEGLRFVIVSLPGLFSYLFWERSGYLAILQGIGHLQVFFEGHFQNRLFLWVC